MNKYILIILTLLSGLSFAETTSVTISKEAESLGLPRITTKSEFIRIFGACIADKTNTSLSSTVASTCVVESSYLCKKALDVGSCNLLRYGFSKDEELSLIFLSLSGRRAITAADDVFNGKHGQAINSKDSQKNEYAVFDRSWNIEGISIELTNMYSLVENNIDSPKNASLIFIARKNVRGLSINQIEDKSPTIDQWYRQSPVFSIRDNCIKRKKIPISAFEDAGIFPDRYVYASTDTSKDFYIFAYSSNKNVGFIAFTKTKQACIDSTRRIDGVNDITIVRKGG